MYYIADLHVHSHYAYATSKDLDLERLYQWACIKGIHVVGTGDFTHPQWFETLQQQLVPDGNGLYRLQHPPAPAWPHDAMDIRFCLSTEVSCLYKHADQWRKNHLLIYAPDMATVAKLNAKLATHGNLAADGRPTLRLSARDLLEIVLETSSRAHLIPAHLWTPWFSTLGSKGGYDCVEACFRDLTPHIFALETGLSSDPAMNRQCSQLDRYTMVSNSDAHSPCNLGREATLFDTALTYDAMFDALKMKVGWLGTFEFFPEEGKYYMDGHRRCGVCLHPETTQQHQGLCPVCKCPLTPGVLHRVRTLADRHTTGSIAEGAPCTYLVPLMQIIAQLKGMGVRTHGVRREYQRLIGLFGNEFKLLTDVSIDQIAQRLGRVYAEAIRRLRAGQVKRVPGYDGVYGQVHIFQPEELAAAHQPGLF
ncbi:MAG: endonuclease Q family protein [Bacteroidota bacterium]